MNKVTTISIGIPAYNEAANIKQLLGLILAQKGSNFTLQKVYVVSDGSTDNTADEVSSLNDKRILFKDDKKRLGKSARLEEIYRLNTADVLILMDADVVFNDTNLFSKLITQVDFTKTGIAAINAQPLPPHTFFERSLDASVYFAKRIAEQWYDGDNYLSFKGCFLALSGKLVDRINMPSKLINNDAYLYFAAKREGFTAQYVRNCIVYYKSPITLVDHINQSSRFQLSKDELQGYFNKDLLSYAMPKKIILKSLTETIIKKHIFFISYLGIHLISKMKKQKAVKPTWKIADSTKQKIALSN